MKLDGIFLPDTIDGSFTYSNNQKVNLMSSDEESTFTEENVQENTFDIQPIAQSIDDAIQKLGGSVLVKYCGKTPRDALWISSEKSLRCTTSSDVLLLLKASDRIKGNSTQVPCLSLIKWKNDWNSSYEFRVFYINGILQGISQRDCSAYFLHLLEMQSEILTFLKRYLPVAVQNYREMYLDCYADPTKEVFYLLQVHSMDECMDFCLMPEDLIEQKVSPEESLLKHNDEHIGETKLFLLQNDQDSRLSIFKQNMFPIDSHLVNKS